MTDRKVDRLPKTDLMLALRDGRDAELSVRQHFLGNLKREDFTAKEQEKYNRVVSLQAVVSKIKGRLVVQDILEAHCQRHDCEIATARRDWKLLNSITAEFRAAELELERGQLYKMAWKAIEIAKENKDSRAMSAAVKTAKDVLGLDTKDGGATMSSDKIEQHINIIVSDNKTNRILEEMVRNDVSIMQWNMSLDDILAEEATPKIIDIEHEEVTEIDDTE